VSLTTFADNASGLFQEASCLAHVPSWRVTHSAIRCDSHLQDWRDEGKCCS